MTKIKVAVIEPLPVLGLGLKTLFERYAPEFHIVDIYYDVPSFREQCPKCIEIILLNTSTVGYSRHFDIRELFSDYADALLVALTTEFLLPNAFASFDGVLCLYDDGDKVSQQLKGIVKKSMTTSVDDNVNGLLISNRERDIVIAVANGQTSKEIADKLCLSPHTVISYRKKIALKLGLKGTAGFTAYAIVNNLIKTDEVIF